MYNDKMNDPALMIDVEYSRVKDIYAKSSSERYTNNKFYPIQIIK